MQPRGVKSAIRCWSILSSVLGSMAVLPALALAQMPGEPGSAPRAVVVAPPATATVAPSSSEAATATATIGQPLGDAGYAGSSSVTPAIPSAPPAPPVVELKPPPSTPPAPPVIEPKRPPSAPAVLELQATSTPTVTPADGEMEDYEDSLIPRELDLAWDLYHTAALELAAGNKRVAVELLEELLDVFGDHPAAEKAYLLLEAADPQGRRPYVMPMDEEPEWIEPLPRHRRRARPPEPPLPPGTERKSGLARTELVFGQAMHGMVFGVEVCRILECDNGLFDILAANVGAGIGVGAAVLLSRGGVTQGHATLLNSGTLWGAWQGFALLGAVSPTDFAAGAWGVLIASQLGGVGLGEVAWRVFEPTAGQVSLANSTGIWGGLITGMMLAATGSEFDNPNGWGTMLAVSDIALLGGAVLSAFVPTSRSRMLLIDLGGLSGMLVGMAVALVVDGIRPEPEIFWPLTAAGAVSGLALTALLTRGWDLPEDPPVALGVMPTIGGAVVSIGAQL